MKLTETVMPMSEAVTILFVHLRGAGSRPPLLRPATAPGLPLDVLHERAVFAAYDQGPTKEYIPLEASREWEAT